MQGGSFTIQESSSPLGRLVLFMVCLSIAGSVVAGAHYYAVDLPAQVALSAQAPLNYGWNTGEKCDTCTDNCNDLPEDTKYSCLANCELIC